MIASLPDFLCDERTDHTPRRRRCRLPLGGDRTVKDGAKRTDRPLLGANSGDAGEQHTGELPLRTRAGLWQEMLDVPACSARGDAEGRRDLAQWCAASEQDGDA